MRLAPQVQEIEDAWDAPPDEKARFRFGECVHRFSCDQARSPTPLIWERFETRVATLPQASFAARSPF